MADKPLAPREPSTRPIAFLPPEPKTLAEAGLSSADVEGLVLKMLLVRGALTTRVAADSLRLPRKLASEAFERLRAELLVAIKGSSGLEDYIYQLTEAGFDRAERLARACAYSGVAPVTLESYVTSVVRQTLATTRLTLDMLRSAFSAFHLTPQLQSQLGQAINDGKGMFLFGPPGNGKTSVSERVIGAYRQYLWIPHVISIDGELVRLYDPRSHQAVDAPELDRVEYDRRWMLIHRPTIIVGGELTMSQLELQHSPAAGISEAPVQMRANGGALVVDDFGRQRMPTSELLNRLIVPMEKQIDYLNLESGRQASMPFHALLVFSTNLEPRDLVDEAFLRRIPYKIEVGGPTENEFVELFVRLAHEAGCRASAHEIVALIDRHYRPTDRPLRYCHPRDLLRQIRNYCEFLERPLELNCETLDAAVANYFAGL